MRACLSALCSATFIFSAPAEKMRSTSASSTLCMLDVHRGDVELGEELLLHVAEGADGLLGEHERGEHVLFGDLLRAGLEHVDGVLGAGDHEVEIGVLGLDRSSG